MKLNPTLAEAMMALRASPDFEVFMKAVANEGEMLVEQLIYNDDQLDIRRGYVRCLTDLMKIYADAPEYLKKTQNRS